MTELQEKVDQLYRKYRFTEGGKGKVRSEEAIANVMVDLLDNGLWPLAVEIAPILTAMRLSNLDATCSFSG